MKKIDVKEMISEHEEFVSCYFGSSSLDGGHVNYTTEQMKVLFASVPNIFPYDWNGNDCKNLLTDKQYAVLEIIHNLEGHPQHTLILDRIPRIISIASHYAEGRLKQE